jgi:hypothetical protein
MNDLFMQEYVSDDIVVDIADLDCVFLTFDEPKKEEFWLKVKNIVPWAKRVDGVKGSDTAHKAAANASATDRFILIDGDNIPDPAFFNLQLRLEDWQKDCVFRWKARNYINGLCYGNGGISMWTKEFALNMKTHENSDGAADTAVEFCFDPNYIAMHDCYSTTYPNQTPFQAFRAGFREGVKMCLDRGVKPSLKDFEDKVHKRNFDNLQIWMSIGADVENGQYAINGARLGTYMTMLVDDWNYTDVHDFDKIKEIWTKYKMDNLEHENHTLIRSTLEQRLGLEIPKMNAQQSKFFKYHYETGHKNLGVMRTEMSVIRNVEGW